MAIVSYDALTNLLKSHGGEIMELAEDASPDKRLVINFAETYFGILAGGSRVEFDTADSRYVLAVKCDGNGHLVEVEIMRLPDRSGSQDLS